MKTFKSKISYGFLLAIFILFSIITYVLINETSSTFHSVLIVSIIHIVIIAFLIYTFYSTEYSIENKLLKVRCGFIFKKNIEIDKIKSISKTNSLLSAPAASLTDRIELKYGTYNSIVISPKEKKVFVEALLRINPYIQNNIII